VSELMFQVASFIWIDGVGSLPASEKLLKRLPSCKNLL